jgi:hypothetical protein
MGDSVRTWSMGIRGFLFIGVSLFISSVQADTKCDRALKKFTSTAKRRQKKAKSIRFSKDGRQSYILSLDPEALNQIDAVVIQLRRSGIAIEALMTNIGVIIVRTDWAGLTVIQRIEGVSQIRLVAEGH